METTASYDIRIYVSMTQRQLLLLLFRLLFDGFFKLTDCALRIDVYINCS